MDKEQEKVIAELKLAYKKAMVAALKAPLHIGCEIIIASREAEDKARFEARQEVGISEEAVRYLDKLF